MAEHAPRTSQKLESLLGDLRKLPLLPATAQQAMALANNDSASLHEFTRLIERDVTLATSILKLANSPIFSWGRTIESLDQAVVRLGLRECQNLLVAVSMRNLFLDSDPRTKGICAVLWKHCFLSACLCRRLNQYLHFDHQGEEFTAALLHDLGRILLAMQVPDRFADVDPMNFIEGPELLARERIGFGIDHCELGGQYAIHNSLPATAVVAIRHHHDLPDVKQHRGVLGLVVAADDLANYLMRGESLDSKVMDFTAGFSYLTQGWPADKIVGLKRFVPRLLTETIRAADVDPAAPARAPLADASSQASRPEPTQSLWGGIRSWLGG